MIKHSKKIISIFTAAALLCISNAATFASDLDKWTEAKNTSFASNNAWEDWCTEWESVKQDYTQISLTPGKNASELNFAWYSKDSDNNCELKFAKNKDLSDADNISVSHEKAIDGYLSNKATVTGLKDNTTYYYSYKVNGKWSDVTPYSTKSTDKFSFLYVGDPQIGSSYENIATGEDKEQGQDNACRNDSFNWNNTLNTALKNNPDISFMVSAGDQIQTRDKKNASKTFDKNEIEYRGYLSADALKSLPVATTVGNHDSLSGNYSYHFNNPNASDLGSTMAGGDYYFTYGNTLFIDLNTNNLNIAEHKELIEKAISENKDAKWRIVTLHQDIYGSGEHSNEPDIVDLRYNLIPVLEDNKIDVVLTGHDHTYSRSFILNNGAKDSSKFITADEFDNYINGTTPSDTKYENYINSIGNDHSTTNTSNSVVNPDGILYMTANSASGSKYYNLVEKKQTYIASRWQEDVPTYSTIDITDDSFTINTFRVDNNEKIDDTFTITKTN